MAQHLEEKKLQIKRKNMKPTWLFTNSYVVFHVLGPIKLATTVADQFSIMKADRFQIQCIAYHALRVNRLKNQTKKHC